MCIYIYIYICHRCIYMYMYVCVLYMYMCMYVYIYIYIERERDVARLRSWDSGPQPRLPGRSLRELLLVSILCKLFSYCLVVVCCSFSPRELLLDGCGYHVYKTLEFPEIVGCAFADQLL